MSASSGWTNPSIPPPESARPAHDHTGEPVGYDLDDPATYEQPPLPPLQPWQVPAPRPVPTSEFLKGFGVSLAGVASLPFAPPFAMGLCATGALMCSVALIRSRRGGTSRRGFAVAGLVLGMVGLVVAILLAADFVTGHTVSGPG